MDDEMIVFKDAESLYKRITPALDSKCEELRKIGMSHITRKDIWMYLVENEWKGKKELELHNIVSDILFVDKDKLEDYVSNKIIKNSRD